MEKLRGGFKIQERRPREIHNRQRIIISIRGGDTTKLWNIRGWQAKANHFDSRRRYYQIVEYTGVG
jgi:hypothetical protein